MTVGCVLLTPGYTIRRVPLSLISRGKTDCNMLLHVCLLPPFWSGEVVADGVANIETAERNTDHEGEQQHRHARTRRVRPPHYKTYMIYCKRDEYVLV